MKVSFATIGARYTMPLEEVLPRIAEMGYDGAEIWGPHVLGRTDEELLSVKSIADSCGLAIPQLTPYFCFTGDTEAYEWSMQHARDMAHYAELLGAKNIRSLTSVGIKMTDFKKQPVYSMENLAPSAVGTEEQWQQVIRAYKELGKGDGPIWAIETHNNNLSDSLEGCKRLLKEIDSPRVKLTYQWLNDATIEEGLEALWDDIAQVHLQHASSAGEERSRQCLKYLADHGYEGFVTIEFCDEPIWETALKELAVVKEYM